MGRNLNEMQPMTAICVIGGLFVLVLSMRSTKIEFSLLTRLLCFSKYDDLIYIVSFDVLQN